MAFPTYADSDADDEYERSVMTSPILHTDDDTSPTDSDPPSTEHTPTTFEHQDADRLSPRTVITDWTAEECANFVTSLGLSQYCNNFLENAIVGEALVALRHEELKEMGVASVGHRLTILKSVYDVKVKQDVPVEADHYIPLSADASINNKKATQEDISRIIQSIHLRDERLFQAEADLKKVTEDYRKLREELLPIFRIAKERSQPLPYQPSANSPDLHSEPLSSPISQHHPEKQSTLGRKLSKRGKNLWLSSTPKQNNSPTHIPQSVPEGKEGMTLDPSAAAVAASTHLSASMNGGSQPSNSPNQINMPSPTSPNTYHNQPTIASRNTFARDGNGQTNSAPSTGRTAYSYGDEFPHVSYGSNTSTLVGDNSFSRNNPTPGPGRSRGNTRDQDDSPSSGGREAPSVEIFKSFRVSMEDPCYKVLPAALKKYNIVADWRQYALYIVFGDQERCLGLEEKPLILFKQLDKEGRKPMFMLRRHAAPMEGHSGPTGSSMLGFDTGLGGGRGQNSIQLPGGVL